ncbi:expressed unknown protein [Seminavis robusta]|uniref:Uncharacterized protein n=1 Tax=Seminavis robusta TaxID=568900 RepID=A0A9N8DN36_9STRA|nr:expressed unknown protein [Seminavis robusta]|eukprot:Sro218_g090050.1 n/a (252) ;mRNA; r:34285-35040
MKIQITAPLLALVMASTSHATGTDGTTQLNKLAHAVHENAPLGGLRAGSTGHRQLGWKTALARFFNGVDDEVEPAGMEQKTPIAFAAGNEGESQQLARQGVVPNPPGGTTDPMFQAGLDAANANDSKEYGDISDCGPCHSLDECDRADVSREIHNDSGNRYVVAKVGSEILLSRPDTPVSYTLHGSGGIAGADHECAHIILFDGPTGELLGGYWAVPGRITGNAETTPYSSASINSNDPVNGDIRILVDGE